MGTDKTDALKKGLAKEKPVVQHMKHYANERESIIRQTCLKAAVELAKDRKAEYKTPQQVVDIAAFFEKWVNRPTDEKEATDSKD
ncbi:MAG: hypothetical protein ACK5DE_10090 [Bacteroidota bacterium]|jgi:hypothetical protein